MFSKSVGHSVTYKVYNEATGALLFRSHLRKVDRGADINNRVMRVERVDKCLIIFCFCVASTFYLFSAERAFPSSLPLLFVVVFSVPPLERLSC